jgi:hypothetical protein
MTMNCVEDVSLDLYNICSLLELLLSRIKKGITHSTLDMLCKSLERPLASQSQDTEPSDLARCRKPIAANHSPTTPLVPFVDAIR